MSSTMSSLISWGRSLLFLDKIIEGQELYPQYLLPIYIRPDGFIIQIGQDFDFDVKPKAGQDGDTLRYRVISIKMSKDLEHVTLVFSALLNNGEKATIEMNANELQIYSYQQTLDESTFTTINSIAHNDFTNYLRSISSPEYPLKGKELIRRYQLAYLIRRRVHNHLKGLSYTGSFSLGVCDLNHDLKLLKMDSRFSFYVQHVLEKYLTNKSDLDEFLGDHWDVYPLGASGFRIILAFHISLDMLTGLLIGEAYSLLCSQEFDKTTYRYIAFNSLNTPSRESSLEKDVVNEFTDDEANCKLIPTSSKSLHQNSLEWDSFDEFLANKKHIPIEIACVASEDILPNSPLTSSPIENEVKFFNKDLSIIEKIQNKSLDSQEEPTNSAHEDHLVINEFDKTIPKEISPLKEVKILSNENSIQQTKENQDNENQSSVAKILADLSPNVKFSIGL